MGIGSEAGTRIEAALETALMSTQGSLAPPRVATAIRYAIFPPGSRIRPRLCLAVAAACGDPDPTTTDAAAAALEMLHCASLVHDDLPCFDNAQLRRNKPSVHRAFGEREAILAGDALIVMAFDALARNVGRAPARTAALLRLTAGAIALPDGIIAGQAWECEPAVDLSTYHRAKTGALFAAATSAGAIAAGADGSAWRALGEGLGEAYQIADDIRDMAGSAEEIGKPVRRDLALGRPNAVQHLGMTAAVERFEGLLEAAIRSIPRCAGRLPLGQLIRDQAERLVPYEILARAA